MSLLEVLGWQGGGLPAIFNSDLEIAGVPFSEKGVTVNEYLRNPTKSGVYAAGDAADLKGLPLTPVAVIKGHIMASHIIKGNRKNVRYLPMPSGVYTLRALAAAGLPGAGADT